MSIGKKILLACMALLLVSIPATGIVLNRMYYRTLVNSTENYTSMLVDQIAINLNTRTREYEDNILNAVQQWDLFGDYFNNTNCLERYKCGMLSSFVNTRNTTKSPVQDMYVLDASGTPYYYNYLSQSFRGGLETVQEKMRGMDHLVTKGTSAVWFTVPENEHTVYLIRCIYDVFTLQYEGCVAVGIERSLIQNQFRKLENSQNGHLLIYGQEDALIFGDAAGLPDAETLLEFGEWTTVGEELPEMEGERFIFQCRYSGDEKWKVMYLVKDEALMGQAKKVRSAIAAICMVSILAALVCAALISRGIMREIRHLTSHMRQMRSGNWQQLEPPFPKDEIGDITRTYNQMVGDLHKAVQQLAEQMVRTERAQYRALQAEFMELQAMVNPHFIYNAMETINSRAKLSGQMEISQLCTKLGRLMRAAIRPKMELVSLKTELNYVEDYLEIQKTMMDGRLEVFYDFDESPEAYQIPALLLQPLVENAVIHGVDHMEKDAVILVSVSREKKFERECLVIRISDNGMGMDEDTMKKMFELSEKEEKVHYGVQSVIKRIQICYGRPYGLYADSSPGSGTTFTMVLPEEDGAEPLKLLSTEKGTGGAE